MKENTIKAALAADLGGAVCLRGGCRWLESMWKWLKTALEKMVYEDNVMVINAAQNKSKRKHDHLLKVFAGWH